MSSYTLTWVQNKNYTLTYTLKKNLGVDNKKP